MHITFISMNTMAKNPSRFSITFPRFRRIEVTEKEVEATNQLMPHNIEPYKLPAF